MVNLDDARRAADHLRAKAEVERSSVASLLILIPVAAVLAYFSRDAGLNFYAGLVLVLVVGPLALRRLLPKGNLMIYRLALAAYPYNVLLLGLIVWLAASRIPPVFHDDVPQLRWLFPMLALAVPVGYAVAQFSDWARRIHLYPEIRKALAGVPLPEALGEVSALVAQATSSEPPAEAPWAEFRTVPARPSNWRAFLKLDTEEHGTWRAAFSDVWAVVVFKDGRKVEVVPKGGIRIVADDETRPGSRHQLCVLRWNAHLHEGRITQGDFLKIKAWNARR